jgi:hypothetical protein
MATTNLARRDASAVVTFATLLMVGAALVTFCAALT